MLADLVLFDLQLSPHSLLVSVPIFLRKEVFHDAMVDTTPLQWGVKVHDTKAWTQPLCEERRTFHCSRHGVPYILYVLNLYITR